MRVALYDRYGPPEVLYVGSAPTPRPGPGEVLVRVHATTVNGGELVARAGGLRLLTGRSFPKRIGLDLAGEVTAVGDGAAPFAVGDRVWGILPRSQYARGRGGSAADYVTVPVGKLAPAPTRVDLAGAAALMAGGTTALTALRDVARLRPGERLLVTGANGGVGSITVQLGRALGARVTALANGATLDLVRALGAEVALDHATAQLSELGRFDVVVDTVGTVPGQLRRLLTRRGRMVAITVRGVGPAAAVLASLVHGRRRIRIFSGNPGSPLLRDLTAYIDRGEVVPVIARVHPLEEIATAHRALEARGVAGKHVVRLVPEPEIDLVERTEPSTGNRS